MEVIEKPASALSLPWKTRFYLCYISTVTDLSRRRNGTINRRLLNLINIRSPTNPNPINGVVTSDVTVDPSRDLWFRVFVPTPQIAAGENVPVIVFFHGGGFVYLSADSKAYDAVCRRFARRVHAVVLSVNYRLAPEHRYPAQFDDGFDVLRFLDEEGKNKPEWLPENADLSRCFLAGDSAGGNLAHHVTKRACESKFGRVKVIGLVSIQPFFGGEERTESEIRLRTIPLVSVKRTDWIWKAFMPKDENWGRDHEAINVSGPRAADLAGVDFPATMVVVAGFDPLQDWQRRYYQWLKKCGKEAYLKEYPNMSHAFYIFPELPESGQLIMEVTEFVRKCSSSKASKESSS